MVVIAVITVTVVTIGVKVVMVVVASVKGSGGCLDSIPESVHQKGTTIRKHTMVTIHLAIMEMACAGGVALVNTMDDLVAKIVIVKVIGVMVGLHLFVVVNAGVRQLTGKKHMNEPVKSGITILVK